MGLNPAVSGTHPVGIGGSLGWHGEVRFSIPICDKVFSSSLVVFVRPFEWINAFRCIRCEPGAAGGREGHLRAAVVVELGHPGAAHHSTVGVRPSVRLPVPETPDVALWTNRR